MTDRTVPTEPMPDERTIYECTGCGTVTRDPAGWLDMCRKAGGLSCCPERKMVPLAASPAAPGAEMEPVAYYWQPTCAGKPHGEMRVKWGTPEDWTRVKPLYPSPPQPPTTTDAIRAQARREALEEAERSIKRLKGTLSYIAAQAKAGYPTALSVIRANAESALDDEWQKTVSEAQALLSKKVDDQ